MATVILMFAALVCFGSFIGNTGPKYDRIPRDTMDRWALQVAKNYGMELVATGVGALIDNEEIIWCLSFMNRNPMRVEQARTMVQQIAQGMYHLVNSDPSFLTYFNHPDCRRFYKKGINHVATDKIGFKITFWDANYDRIQQPYVGQAIYTNDKITYLFADPQTQRLVNPIEETFDPASH